MCFDPLVPTNLGCSLCSSPNTTLETCLALAQRGPPQPFLGPRAFSLPTARLLALHHGPTMSRPGLSPWDLCPLPQPMGVTPPPRGGGAAVRQVVRGRDPNTGVPKAALVSGYAAMLCYHLPGGSCCRAWASNRVSVGCRCTRPSRADELPPALLLAPLYHLQMTLTRRLLHRPSTPPFETLPLFFLFPSLPTRS